MAFEHDAGPRSEHRALNERSDGRLRWMFKPAVGANDHTRPVPSGTGLLVSTRPGTDCVILGIDIPLWAMIRSTATAAKEKQ